MQRTPRVPMACSTDPTPHQVRLRIPDSSRLDQSLSPYRAACPRDPNNRKKNLAADNQAIKDQLQLLQNLYPTDKYGSQVSRFQTANKVRPRPRPRPLKKRDVQQTCNFTSMQAQLSELQN